MSASENPSPWPHFVDGLLVVAVDFAAGLVLLGTPTRRNDPTAGIYGYSRLRYVNGVWSRDVPRKFKVGLGDVAPAIDDDLAWREDVTRPAKPLRVQVYPHTCFVSVDRLAFKRALDTLAKVCATGAVGDNASYADLLTVRVHARGVEVASHGAVSGDAEIKAQDNEPATAGLGVAVVSLAALRGLVKGLDYKALEIALESAHPNRALLIRGHRLWTVQAVPMPSMSEVKSAHVSGLTEAITRALPFASADEARPTLNAISLRGEPGRVVVEATDGFRLYREQVEGTAHPFGEQALTLPSNVLTSLRKGKRASGYRFAVGSNENGVTTVTVECDGQRVRCTASGVTYPPTATLTKLITKQGGIAPGWFTRTVTPERLRQAQDWLGGLDADASVTLQFGEGYAVRLPDTPVAVRMTSGAYTLDLADGFNYPTLRQPSRESTTADVPRCFTAGYLLSAFAAFDTKCCRITYSDASEVRTMSAPKYDRAPLYLHDATRVVITMPRRP